MTIDQRTDERKHAHSEAKANTQLALMMHYASSARTNNMFGQHV